MNHVARATRWLPRIDLALEPDFALGSLQVRPSRREVEAGGECRTLQPRVMQVLVALAHPSSEVVSADELVSRCWDGLAVGEDAISRCIGNLRRLATGWAEPPFRIETIAGVGYRLATDNDLAEAAPGPPSTPSKRVVSGRRWAGIALAASGLAVLAAAGGWALLRGQAPPAAPRVAVLPLDALSDRPEVRYLAAGIADEISGALSTAQVEALPRTEATAARSLATDPAVAARLGVGLLLNGSVQQTAGETLVTMRLDNARTHVPLWSGDFRRADGKAGSLGEEIAAKVADIIEIAQFARETPVMRKDDAALSAVLQAHDLIRWNRSPSWGRLLEVAQRASAMEPGFAFGHALVALADGYAIAWGAPVAQRPALLADGRREAARALRLDPYDASAYFALYTLETGYREREAVLLKGLTAARHPSAPLAALYNSEGEVLLSVGRAHDALPYIQRGVSLDPLSALKAAELVKGYEMVGDTGAAQELLGQSLARWPNHPLLRERRLHLAAFSGDPAAARALLATPGDLPANLGPEGLKAWRAFLDARPAAAGLAARSVAAAANSGALDLRTAALMLAGLGDLDDAFAQAEKLAAQPDRDPIFLFEPAAAPLRHDPRFAGLARRFGLIDYWRGTAKWPDACAGPRPEIDCRAMLSAAGL